MNWTCLVHTRSKRIYANGGYIPFVEGTVVASLDHFTCPLRAGARWHLRVAGVVSSCWHRTLTGGWVRPVAEARAGRWFRSWGLKFAARKKHVPKNAPNPADQSQPTPINNDRGVESIAHAFLCLLWTEGRYYRECYCRRVRVGDVNVQTWVSIMICSVVPIELSILTVNCQVCYKLLTRKGVVGSHA